MWNSSSVFLYLKLIKVVTISKLLVKSKKKYVCNFINKTATGDVTVLIIICNMRTFKQFADISLINLPPLSVRYKCMYFNNNGDGEYFDSLGPEPKKCFRLYMTRHCNSWTYNPKQLQAIISKFYGHYCIWYCMMKNRRIDLYELLRNVSNDTGLNDFLVHRFACRLLFA